VKNLDGYFVIETYWGNGEFKYVDYNTMNVSWNNFTHILKFNNDGTEYDSTRIKPHDLDHISGTLIKSHMYIYGDSHGAACFKGLKIPHRNLFYHGITMYRIGRDKAIVNFKETHISKDNIYCLAYGEVDVRCHIGKQVENGKDYRIVCKELVDAYFISISHVIKEYKAIIIVGIIPPTDSKDHVHKVHNPPLPYIGTNEYRIIYTFEMNRLLKEYCEIYSYIYFNPFDYYKREDGCLNYNLSDGCVHIGHTEHILDEFNKLYGNLQ
jgi:hypothetical protein